MSLVVSFFNSIHLKNGIRGKYTSVMGQKYSRAQKTVGAPHISFDLQAIIPNRIFKTTNNNIMSLLPLILVKFMETSKLHSLNFNNSSLLYCSPPQQRLSCEDKKFYNHMAKTK